MQTTTMAPVVVSSTGSRRRSRRHIKKEKKKPQQDTSTDKSIPVVQTTASDDNSNGSVVSLLCQLVAQASQRVLEVENVRDLVTSELQRLISISTPLFSACGGYMELTAASSLLSGGNGAEFTKYLMCLHCKPAQADMLLRYLASLRDPMTWPLAVEVPDVCFYIPFAWNVDAFLVSSCPKSRLGFLCAYLCGDQIPRVQSLLMALGIEFHDETIMIAMFLGAAAGGRIGLMHYFHTNIYINESTDAVALLLASYYGNTNVVAYYQHQNENGFYLLEKYGMGAVMCAVEKGNLHVAQVVEDCMRSQGSSGSSFGDMSDQSSPLIYLD